MDPLFESDLQRAREQSPGEKLAYALELMSTGIRLKRAALRLRHPSATEGELDALLRAWLTRES